MTDRAPAHPFAGSSWMWTGDRMFDIVNRHMQARRTFDLKHVPAACELAITGDARYRLWVNGTPVARGPARGYPDHWPFDRVDIAPFLVRGRNVIAVQLHSYGVGTFGYIGANATGLLVAGKAGDTDLASGGAWKVRQAPELRRHFHRVSFQLGFQEHVVAAKLDAWREAGFDDSSWRGPDCCHHGAAPWTSLEERGIPMLRECLSTPVACTHTGSGAAAAVPAEAECPVRAWVRDRGPLTAASGTGSPVRLEASGAGRWTVAVLDVGEEIVGSLDLRLAGGGPGAILDVLVTERVEADGPVFHLPEVSCAVAFGMRIHLDGTERRIEQFDHWGFRHIVLVARNTTAPLTVSAQVRNVGYPLDAAADLRTGDARLDGIWDISVRAQQRCSLDAYVDCPWREQAQWWGDARVQAANTFVLSGDARLLARGIRSLGGQMGPEGLTYGHAPTIAHTCILPDFTLTWFSTLHDHWRQTGDISLVKEQWPRIETALAYFRAKLTRSGPGKGLLPYDPRYWLFLDWCPIFKDGWSTVFNLLHVQALDQLAELATRAGRRTEAAQLRREAAAARKAVLRLQKGGVFAGGIGWDGKLVAQDSAHADALAYLNNLVPAHDVAVIARLKALCARPMTPEYDKMVPSPFFMHYILSALDRAGEQAAVVDCIRRWWGTMLDRGLSTTEEGWFSNAGAASLCHAWSAHPIVHLTRILLGVRQGGVAWKSVDIAPSFLTDRAAGAVATPRGPVHVSWEKSGTAVTGEVTVPKGVAATLRLPGAKPKRLAAGKHRFAM